VYVILNLCRVLAWLKEGCVLSKEEGGRWGRKNLPEKLIPVVESALECYRTGGKMPCSGRMLDGFAGHMLGEIKAKAVEMMKG
jgi:streptomycin 3"-adenylyltransferase